MQINRDNSNAIQNIIGQQHWDLQPYMLPTRPYLRSNTYRLLGSDAATRGDITRIAVAPEHILWPYAKVYSIKHAAQRILQRYGNALGEENMHIIFHKYLTDPQYCSSTVCHMKS